MRVMWIRNTSVQPLGGDLLLAGLGAADSDLSLAFVRRFQRTVFGVAFGILGEARLAEDVAAMLRLPTVLAPGSVDP
jgi:hypothetical protein